MRVAIFAESYLPYLSGVTVSTDALARGLGALGHDVLVIAPRPAKGAGPGGAGSPGPEPRFAWMPSYQLPRIVPAGYRMPLPLPATRALRAAAAFRPQVVHAQSPFVSGLMARRLARSGSAALVFTHHTRFADYRHYLGPLAEPGRQLTDAYLRRFWVGCDAVIAPSAGMAAEIRTRLGERGRPIVRVVPTGIDVDAIRALTPVDPRRAAGWPPDAIVAVTFGRLAREKSVDVVLEATGEAARRDDRLRLLVIGGGPAAASLQRRAARPDLVGRVAFSGPLPRLEALAHAAGADLFAFASRTETQGLVLAEALASGLPGVAVEGPGVADSIRHGIDGLVVPAEPVDGQAGRLADAMLTLVTDASRRIAMARRASADAGRFDVRRRVSEIDALYRELFGGAG